MITAEICEIFVSLQGEGLYCGQKQVFIRFAGCNLDCVYCDEPASMSLKRSQAPFSIASACAEVLRLAHKNLARAVSFTGGEPLLNWEFIKAMGPALKQAGLAVHLETNGTLYRELAGLKGLADVIAMDLKLPSSTGGKAYWTEHAKFLAVAPKKTFLKLVVTAGTSAAEFKKAVDMVSKVSPAVPFFIQPASPVRGVRPPSRAALDSFYRLAALRLEVVRILPQLHKLWGIK
ncbi:MAG: 7-carboxy-7-deazaguanine synthase QueE [Elusimicrobiales bacterium]|jgi:organic radical activating enzyme